MYGSILANGKSTVFGFIGSLGFTVYPLLFNISDAYCILADAIFLFPLCEETLLQRDINDTWNTVSGSAGSG